MREVITKGSSIDDATENALQQLGARREEVEVEPIAAGSSGFLGLFGRKPAQVRVSLRPDEKIQTTVFLRNVLKLMNVNASFEVTKEGDELLATLDESASPLIGSRGQTLESLQYLVSRFVGGDKDKDDYSKVIIDIDGYRQKRHEELIEMATRMAEKAAETKRDQRTDPLPADERRIIHMTLKENADVTTFSIGEGSRKRVVIATTDPEAQRRRSGDRDRERGGDRERSGGRGGRGGRGRGGSNRGRDNDRPRREGGGGRPPRAQNAQDGGNNNNNNSGGGGGGNSSRRRRRRGGRGRSRGGEGGGGGRPQE